MRIVSDVQHYSIEALNMGETAYVCMFKLISYTSRPTKVLQIPSQIMVVCYNKYPQKNSISLFFFYFALISLLVKIKPQQHFKTPHLS